MGGSRRRVPTEHEPAALAWGNYAPPWFDARTNRWYGPVTPTAYEDQWELYGLRGFWDPPRGERQYVSPPVKHGYDLELLAAYAAERELPIRQFEVVMCLVDGLSVRATARQLHVDRAFVRECVQAVLKKAHRWRHR